MTLQIDDATYRSVCFSPKKHSHYFWQDMNPRRPLNFQNSSWKEMQELMEMTSIQTKDQRWTTQRNLMRLWRQQRNVNLASLMCPMHFKKIPILLRMFVVVLPCKVQHKPFCPRAKHYGNKRQYWRIIQGLSKNDIPEILSESTYDVSKVVLKEYEKAKYLNLTLNKLTCFKILQMSISRQDTPSTEAVSNTQSVRFPADRVLSLQHFTSRLKFQSKLIPNVSKKTVKFTECGLGHFKLTVNSVSWQMYFFWREKIQSVAPVWWQT